MFNLVPREFNDADNMTQQGSPFEDWLRRDETIMGTRPFVHVTDTVRAAQRYDAEQRARADLRASTWNDFVPSRLRECVGDV